VGSEAIIESIGRGRGFSFEEIESVGRILSAGVKVESMLALLFSSALLGSALKKDGLFRGSLGLMSLSLILADLGAPGHTLGASIGLYPPLYLFLPSSGLSSLFGEYISTRMVALRISSPSSLKSSFLVAGRVDTGYI